MSAEYLILIIGFVFGFYMAWNIGANDIANSMASAVGAKVPVPIFLLLFGGVGIALGIAMAGKRVMTTIGTKITTLTNTRGFSVDFAAATTVLLASKMGLPVSTNHAAVGGVLGAGLARGKVSAVSIYKGTGQCHGFCGRCPELARPMDVEPISVYHIVRLAGIIGSIADHAENAGDMMRAMMAK